MSESPPIAPPPPVPQAPPLSYAGPNMHSRPCPLCRKRPVIKKEIYGHPVCKKCFYAFANRRQLGYLIDALLFLIPSYALGYMIGLAIVAMGVTDRILFACVAAVATLPIVCLFLMKDGFRGRSLGRLATDTIVLDEHTGQPIGFVQSFKRNLVLMVGQIPIVGGFASLVVIIVIAVQVAKGYRIGDRFAQTKVIWKRY